MAFRNATAEWKGDFESGGGSSRAPRASSAATTRPGRASATPAGPNPEELVAAAHASCFSMALSLRPRPGRQPARIDPDRGQGAVLKEGEGFAIKKIDLVTVGRVPGIDDAAFQEAAQAAKAGCPISLALGAVPEITLDATLEAG